MIKSKASIEASRNGTTFDPLRDYITYYRSLKSPGFAVLVTGDWGSGKTYQIRSLLPEKDRYYVSLFGLKTREEVYSALLAQMYPADVKAKKEMTFWSDNKNILGLPVGGLLSAAISRTIRTKIDRSRIIIFDDLERSSVPPKTLLGVINFLVEHEECKVVIIAHDAKVTDSFSESKEKVIGHTVSVKPRTQEAFEHFSKQLNSTAQKNIALHKSLILQLFLLSDCKSLRILRYVLASVERFYGLLEDSQIKNDSAVRQLLSLFVAISIEVHRGDLGRTELSKRIHSYSLVMAMRSQQPTATMDSAQKKRLEKFGTSYERYKVALEISNLDLSDELLVDMLIDGKFDKVALQEYLESTGHFEEAKDQPAWRRFMNFDSMSDEDAEKAVKTMDRQFEKREVTDLGELMHIWSFRIMRVREGLLDSDIDTQVGELKKYFDDLVEASTFPLRANKDLFRIHPAYGGYLLWGAEENVTLLNDIFVHVGVCERKMLEKSFPEIRKEIVSKMRSAPEKLNALLTYEDNVAGKYQEIPALLSIKPNDFLEILLDLPKSSWDHVYRALTARRIYLSPNGHLRDEIDWYNELEREMKMKAEESRGTLNSIRIRRHIPRTS